MAQRNIGQEKKIWAAASYLWILSVIVLVARKNDDYIRSHANQGVFLFALSLFVWFPVIGWLLGLVVAVLAVVGIAKAISGEKWQLPVFASTAKKFGEWLITTLKI